MFRWIHHGHMYTMIINHLGGHKALEKKQLTLKELEPNEVRIEIKSIGCNFADTLITQGKYQVQPPLPFAPGFEIAGVVTKTGQEVTKIQSGDRVLALLDWGGFATHTNVSEQRVFKISDQMNFDTAAALGIAYLTSYLGLVRQGRLQNNDWLLVHAAAGGVGLAAVQIGKALGAKVIGTAGTQEKLNLILENGADHGLNYRDKDWPKQVLDLTGGGGVQVTYDPVGGDMFSPSLKCLAFEGRHIVIGFAGGYIPELKTNKVLLKNMTVTGLYFHLYFTKGIQHLKKAMQHLNVMVEEKQIRPLVSQAFPLEQASEALGQLANRKTTGKIILHP